MSFNEIANGIHEFLTLGDVLAIFGHNANYIVCSRRALVAHTETTGVSIMVKITRHNVRQPRWTSGNEEGRQIHEEDCLWSAIGRETVIADVGSLFGSYDVVWLMRGSAMMWFRGYCADKGEWSDSVNKWPEKRLCGHPGPREGRIGWLRNCGSDATEARSAAGLPPLHLWEAIEWLEGQCPAIPEPWTVRFHKQRDSSNWIYSCGENEFLSWQNEADASTCASWAHFVLDQRSVPVLRGLLDWAARFTPENPLICRVSMRDVETVRLMTSTPSTGCAIDFLLAI
jgi:hypothetical protein